MNITQDLMTTKIITAKASDTVATAYRLMLDHGIRHIPIMDDRNVLVGILSDRDVQRAMSVKRINAIQQEVKLDPKVLIEAFMSWPVYVVSETTTIKRVAEEMLKQKVSAFIVEDHLGKMKGIITSDDLLKLFLKDDSKPMGIGLKTLGHFFLKPEVY
jgi:acetoin utilization protein AcuB